MDTHGQLQTIQRMQKELEILARVSEAAASEPYLDQILQLIVTVTAELMNSKICSLMLLDESQQHLVIKATQALSPAYRNKPPISVARSLSGQAITEKRPICVADVTQDARYMFPDIARRAGLRSLLCAPLIVQDRVLGVINCYTTEVRHFNEDDIRSLTTIANQAAVAIERIRLLECTEQLKQSLEDRKAIERAKGILMERLRISEPEAFKLMQKQGMERRTTLRAISDAVILANDLNTTVLKHA